MMVHKRALAAVAALFLVAGCSGGGSAPSTLTPAAHPGGSAPSAPTNAQAHFRLGTQADKAQQRPSLSGFSRAPGAPAKSVQPMDGRHGGNGVHYKFVTSLAMDGNGNFTEWTPQCDPSIWDAPWYFAEGNSSLPIASSTTLAICTSNDEHDDALHPMNSIQHTPTPTPSPTPTATPTPTPVPTATPQATNLYIVKLDIGWWDFSVTPVSGPAYVEGSNWVFPGSGNDAFQDDHLYVFFVAKAVTDDGGHHGHDH